MKIFLMIILATTYFMVISTQASAQFSLSSLQYNCSSNLRCLGSAHIFNGEGVNRTTWNYSEVPIGRLSLIPETREDAFNQAGVAYYNTSLKLFDKASNTAVSFSTDFRVDILKGLDGDNYSAYIGDGMTFVMSSDISGTISGTISGNISAADFDGAAFGIYNRSRNYTSSVRLAVIEFDTVQNQESPLLDINNNHVSIDLMGITAAVAADAGTVGVDLSQSFHAWVDYCAPTKQLEVRVSKVDNIKPIARLLALTVDLSEAIGEEMWVGFSAGSGGLYSNYYPGNWTVGPYVGPSTLPATNLGLLVGVPSGVLLACIVILFFVQRRYGRRRGLGYWQLRWLTFIKEDLVLQIEGTPKRFCYKELSVATNNFSKESMLGQGGSGSVYRGVLLSGTRVAVKNINKKSDQGKKEFMAEVSIINQLRHKNLIKLLGWCENAPKEKYLLVYELMPKGSLDKALFGPAETPSLPWLHRFNIVKGIAAALEYLHQGFNQQLQVIHRDVKSSNIMLDEEWIPKLGDFGLARLVDHLREEATTDMAGTYGYIAPEVVVLNQFTDKTDVYAFGTVVLEVACGRRAVQSNVPKDELPVLVDWVWQKLSEGDMMSTVDKRLEDTYDRYWMEVMLSIGLICAHPDPECRPNMRHVVQVLEGTAIVPPIPPSKPTLVFRSILRPKIFSDDSGKTENTASSRRSSPLPRSLSTSKILPSPSSRGSSPVP